MNLREFQNWAISQGQVANPEPNYKYLGQCVSLIQQYLYNVFNIPFKAHGNAKDWAYNVPNSFDKLPVGTNLQRGDILVYGANYGGGYGHIGIIDAESKFLDQNGVRALHVGVRDNPFNGYVCVLRHQGGVDCGDPVQPSTFTVRIDKSEANVRHEPNTQGSLVKQPSGLCYLVAGDTFEAVDQVDGENISGNNKWYKSARGNYVWSGGCSRI